MERLTFFILSREKYNYVVMLFFLFACYQKIKKGAFRCGKHAIFTHFMSSGLAPVLAFMVPPTCLCFKDVVWLQ